MKDQVRCASWAVYAARGKELSQRSSFTAVGRRSSGVLTSSAEAAAQYVAARTPAKLMARATTAQFVTTCVWDAE